MTRLATTLFTIGLSAVAVATYWPFGPNALDPEIIEIEVARSTDLEIVWAGDTMIGDGAQPAVDLHGHTWPLAMVSTLLRGDVVIVNSETAITTLFDPFLPNKRYSYRSDPESTRALASAGVDVLGIANNHIMDQGPTGLGDTIRHAEVAGLTVFGAGVDQAAAERPLLIQKGELIVGVVGLGKFYGESVTAGPDRAGTIPLSAASIIRGHRLATEAGADFVVAYVHWGENYDARITDQQRAYARAFGDAGYDLVIGTGPHLHQRVAMVGATPVFYSLGNFVFGTPGRFDDESPGFGLVVTSTFTPSGLSGVAVRCIQTDNRIVAYQPRLCSEEDSALVLAELGMEGTMPTPIFLGADQ